ncbi:MAG TPA: GNAT family N-acetyltransferase [Motilibacteraceae bacterium]|nr:GNAT family N-acetyltransferase [Motilibacteraceae bacterium]
MSYLPYVVEPVAPADERAFAQWYSVLDAVHREQRPGEPGWTLTERRARAASADGGYDRRQWLVRDRDGRPVGAAALQLSLRDNPGLAEAELWVLPGARRRGVGSALADVVEETSRAAGREVVAAFVVHPGGADEGPGDVFARRRGYRVVQREVRRGLDVERALPGLAALEHRAAQQAASYELVSWVSRTPEELLADRAALGTAISADAPRGDSAYTTEHWDVARVLARDEELARMDRTYVATAARHRESGRLVALTELAVPNSVPELAWQWDTVVLRAHRGHRLGLLVKAANLRLLREVVPAARRVMTYNDETNRHMIAVNERLGFEVVDAEWRWELALG